MATVVVSYLIVVGVALAFISLPYFLLVMDPLRDAGLIYWRLLFSAFGVVVGFVMLGSLLLQEIKVEPNGIRIDLAREPALRREIGNIAAGLNEPMPSQVYLLGDANAFVTESSEKIAGNRRVLVLGLPLLQMLSVAEFRAVLAHEFGHYYAGDTRLAPWVYNAQRSMAQLYQNLGKNSAVRSFVRRWAMIKGPYLLLLGGLRVYWRLFLRTTHSISRRQEFRSDELACHMAGSEALIRGLETIRRCQVGLGPYWNSFVLPVVTSGYQPQLAHGFQEFMQTPSMIQATSQYLAPRQDTKASPFDTHPPLSQRIERAKLFNFPAPDVESREIAPGAPAISLIDELGVHELRLIRKLIPTAFTDLKRLNWATAGIDVFIPLWRKQVAAFQPFLRSQKLSNFPLLVLDPKPLVMLIPAAPNGRNNQVQRMMHANNILVGAFALCLLDNGWNLMAKPGETYFAKGDFTVDPDGVVSAIRAGALSVVEWSAFRFQRGIGDWSLAACEPVLPGA